MGGEVRVTGRLPGKRPENVHLTFNLPRLLRQTILKYE